LSGARIARGVPAGQTTPAPFLFTAPVPSARMLRALYTRMLTLSASRRAPLWLALVSFAESSFFPVPPDALLVPMVLARPKRAWALAALCTACSVAGGCLGYLIGAELFDRVALPILRAYHAESALGNFRAMYARWGLWVILVKGLTPIPYKLVTIASGAAHFNFAVFVGASIVSRGARFFLEAGLLRRYGDPVRVFIDERLTLVTTLFLVALVLGVLALRFI
jgi:membrane protein YqaA with SNARE-associated domain